MVLILSGCGKQTTDSEIEAFEKELGYEISKGLTEVVDHFDKQLLNQHPNLSLQEAYKNHLNLIMKSDGLTIEKWVPAQIRKDSIFNLYSEGLAEEIWIKPDSVWVSDSFLFKSYRGNKKPRGRKIREGITNYDSLLYHQENTESFNFEGSYLKAFKTIANSNDIASWYYKMKSNAGSISPHIAAQAFLNSKVDLGDYLVKRIILIETYTQLCFQAPK